MSKLTTIKYLLIRPHFTANLPKYLSMMGLIYSIIIPALTVAADMPTQRPALLALTQMRPIASVENISVSDPFDSTFINGSALISQSNPNLVAGTSQRIPVKTYIAPVIIARLGSTESKQASQNISDVKQKVIVTAYSSTVDQCDDSPFITASGTHVRDGIVAANWLPIGAKIRLPEFSGDKVYIVEDRMAKKNGNKVDIWMESRAAAMQFGVRRLTVEILES